MKREIIQLFLEWKNRKNRKPLIVRGARQVGKTFIVHEFGKECFGHELYVNLEESPELHKVFSTTDTAHILTELSLFKGIDIVQGKTLLFIDEIQACPSAIVSLRYFYEQIPDLHVIATGSLLDHTLNEMNLPMPVGRVEFCYLYPMSFKEFLWALSENRLVDYIDNYSLDQPFSDIVHRKLTDLLRYYFFIGGMPEAVKTFADERKLLEVEKVHSSITTSLQYDFAKYGTKSEQQYLLKVFQYVARNPGRKIKYVNIDRDVRSINLKTAFYRLGMSKVITIVSHTASSGVPLTTHLNPDIFKAYFLDIGLAGYMGGINLIDPAHTMTINEGAIAEQFVCQELLVLTSFREPSIFYWTREEKNSNAEIDFLYQQNNHIFPIEVKAGKTGTLKSMHIYLFERKLFTGVRFNLDIPSYGEFAAKVQAKNNRDDLNYRLLSLPLYMVSQLPRLLNHI